MLSGIGGVVIHNFFAFCYWRWFLTRAL